MVEIVLVCLFAILDIYLVVDTKRKLKKRDNACNIVLNNARLKSCEFSIDEALKSLKYSNAAIRFDCEKEV